MQCEGGNEKFFEPHGYTKVELLSESHAAIHTYPEYDRLVVMLNTCRGPCDGRHVFERMRAKIKPTHFAVCEVEMDLISLTLTSKGSWV